MPATPESTVTVERLSPDNVRLGPFENDHLPARFAVKADLDGGNELRLTCDFAGERVCVREVVVRGEAITARDLAGTRLAHVLRAAAEHLGTAPNAAHVGRREGRRPTDEELKLVAAVHAWHFAFGGEPRRAVMGHWGLPRPTANDWVRKATQKFGRGA